MTLTRITIGLISVTLLAACANYRSVEQVTGAAKLAALPVQFESRSLFDQHDPVVAWWQELNDPLLTELIDQALQANHNLQIAQASLQESRALLFHQRLDRFPTVSLEASGARQKLSLDLPQQAGPRISETYQAGFDASWELDLFGHVSNAVKAAKAELAKGEANLRGVRITVAAEVASAYIALRGAQHQLDVAKKNVANQLASYQLSQSLAEIGRADELDTSRAFAQLSLTRATLPQLENEINTALNRLDVLTGKPDSAIRPRLAKMQSLPSLPTAVAVGTPTALLRRRPDLQAAEQRLAATVARYNVRVADLYPRITFNGGLGYLATDLSRLGETQTETFVFGPSIHWAAFNMGRIYAQIDAADARIQSLLAEFEQNVLLALEETDNALEGFAREEQRRAQLVHAAAASARALHYARQKYEIGAENFLSVLDAERSHLSVSAQLAISETKILQDLIKVYKSLGGGWTDTVDPSLVSAH